MAVEAAGAERAAPPPLVKVLAVDAGQALFVAVLDVLLLLPVQGPDGAGRDEPGAGAAQWAGPDRLQGKQSVLGDGSERWI